MEPPFAPFSADLPAALAWVEQAIRALPEDGSDRSEVVRVLQAELEAGRVGGGIYAPTGRPAGLAVWTPSGPMGSAVRLSFLDPSVASPDRYGELLDATERAAGPLVFAAPLPGLSASEEAAVLTSRGFAPFSRSEMRFPFSAPAPPVVVPEGVSLRPMRPGDEPELARVHAAAYRDRFDWYLFLQDSDPLRDASLLFADLFRGRWGEMLPDASVVAEARGRTVGATAVVQGAERALIADVCVDPAAGGQGIGRAIVTATVRALKERNVPVIALAVTEGNRRAVRLYERIGFVRALGPSREWYNTRLIPVSPEAD